MRKIENLLVGLLGMLLCCTCSKTEVEMLGSIYGTVVQAIGGEPVAKATVTLSPGGKSSLTGADGRYEFGQLEPGDYRVQVWAESYGTETKTVKIEPGVKVNVDVMLKSGSGSIQIVNNYLDFGSDDNTRVFDVKNRGKAPLYFEIKENEDWLMVSPQSDTLQSAATRPVTVTIDRTKLRENKSYTLSVASDAGSEEVMVKVTVEDVGNLYGVITDGITEEPLQGVNVTLLPLGRAMTTGSDGRYEFSRLAVGEYSLQLTKDKYRTDNRNVTIKTGETTKLDVVMKAGKGNLQVVKNYLDFGTDSKILVFDIQNTGLTELQFEMKGVEEWMTVEPMSGTIASGLSIPVTVTLNRPVITESKNSKFTVASDAGSQEVTVRVIAAGSGGGEGSGDASVISSGLIAFYTFDDGTCDDATLNAYDGNTLGQPEFVADSRNGKGRSLLLVATKGQYVNVPYNPLFDKYNYTLSFWIKDFSDGFLLGAYNSADFSNKSRSSFPRLICRNGQLVMYCNYDNYDESPAFNYEANMLKGDGKWHMITVTVSKGSGYNDPFQRKLYVDGRLMASSDLFGGDFSYSQGKPSEFHFGGELGNIGATTMRLDNIRIYDRDLDREEVNLLYEADR